MICTKCGCQDTDVIDSRPISDGKYIKRRRRCSKCQATFSTYEVYTEPDKLADKAANDLIEAINQAADRIPGKTITITVTKAIS